MEDQFFKKGGDFEAFCQEHSNDRRSELRASTLRLLHQKSDRSWNAIQPLVDRLSKEKSIRLTQRYWIVNGFACRASGKACRELAESKLVSFVYLQRLPNVPLHRRSPRRVSKSRLKEMRQRYPVLLKNWKDDSHDDLSLDDVKIGWNVRRIKAEKAWRQEAATGRGVVVAMIDTGLLLTPSLTAALWRNQDETLNGKDDDANGYVDDVFGYNFVSDNEISLGEPGRTTHGSMCGGIIAGRAQNSEKWLTGVAPRAKLMVLNGMGHLRCLEYLLENGADIVSMSYMFVGIELGNYRGLYRTAHEHLTAAGVVSVGGAGNFGSGNPRGQPVGKQIALPKDIPCVIAAAGILQNGKKSPVGSEGPCSWDGVKFYDDFPIDRPLIKPDVTGCFGGFPVWSRTGAKPPVANWKTVFRAEADIGLVTGPRGNSFSGPHAAGVAALMLSVNPDLPAWRVKELMESQCVDIGKEGHDTQFGAGLLDALNAVRAAKAAAVTKLP